MDRSSLRDDDVPLDELERSFREGGGLNKPAATAVRINPRGALFVYLRSLEMLAVLLICV